MNEDDLENRLFGQAEYSFAENIPLHLVRATVDGVASCVEEQLLLERHLFAFEHHRIGAENIDCELAQGAVP